MDNLITRVPSDIDRNVCHRYVEFFFLGYSRQPHVARKVWIGESFEPNGYGCLNESAVCAVANAENVTASNYSAPIEVSLLA